MQLFRPILIVSIALLGGCGSTEQTAEISEPLPPAPPSAFQPPPVAFESSVDTIDASKREEGALVDTVTADTGIRFAVQIGAFKDPKNASALQALARERHTVPVLNEFDPAFSLYQIRVGAFLTRAEARDFLLTMQSRFPGEYRDSWVVECKR